MQTAGNAAAHAVGRAAARRFTPRASLGLGISPLLLTQP